MLKDQRDLIQKQSAELASAKEELRVAKNKLLEIEQKKKR